jgi:hypothetical protein
MSVNNVAKPSVVLAPLENMKELILEKGPMNVNSVVKPSIVPVPLENMNSYWRKAL